MIKQNEIWKDIPGYVGLYQASSLGRIRSLPRNTTSGKVLSQYKNKNGYMYVSLCKNNVAKSTRVHVVVARAFYGDYDRRLQINHIDGEKDHNSIDNLEICTPGENTRHAYKTGLAKVNGIKVIDLDTLQVFESVTDAAKSVCGNKSDSVSRVCTGKRSHYRNHHFAYLSDYENGTIPEYKGKTKRKSSEGLWK